MENKIHSETQSVDAKMTKIRPTGADIWASTVKIKNVTAAKQIAQDSLSKFHGVKCKSVASQLLLQHEP